MGLKYQDSPIFGHLGGKGILPKAALACARGGPWVWRSLVLALFFLHIHKQKKALNPVGNQSSTPLQKSTNDKKLEDAGAGYKTLAENLFAFCGDQCTDLPPFSEEHCSVNEIQQLLVQNEACWHKSCYLKYSRNMLKRFLNRKQALENEPEEKKYGNSQDQKEIPAITVRNVSSVKRRVK